MSERENDLRMLRELLEQYAHDLSAQEVEAFASMRFDLTAYHEDYRQEQLTPKQRDWVRRAYDRVVPQYANLASSGNLAKGIPTTESRQLDAMLAKPKVLKPPPRRKDGDE